MGLEDSLIRCEARDGDGRFRPHFGGRLIRIADLGEVLDWLFGEKSVIEAVPSKLHWFRRGQAHGHFREAVHIEEIINHPGKRRFAVPSCGPHFDRIRARSDDLRADSRPRGGIQAVRIGQATRPEQRAYLHGLLVAEARTLFSALALRTRVVLRHQAYVRVGKNRYRSDKLVSKRLEGADLPRGSVDNKAECSAGHSD